MRAIAVRAGLMPVGTTACGHGLDNGAVRVVLVVDIEVQFRFLGAQIEQVMAQLH